MGIFDGLESFGFSGFSQIDLYKKAEKAKKNAASKVNTTLPEDCLYEKSYTCPVCDKEFKNATIKKAKLRYLDSHTDLRPCYEPIDPLYYDIVLCPHCGYAALMSQFHKITDRQGDAISSNITPMYQPKEYPLILTAEMAIERYKLALYNCVVKKGRDGEKAFICLKIGWLYRHLSDSRNEKLFITQAYLGLKDAYTNEGFPICGLDEPTTAYLVGELARRVGDYHEGLRWIGNLIVRRGINVRLKEKAETVKELIRSEMKAVK